MGGQKGACRFYGQLDFSRYLHFYGCIILHLYTFLSLSFSAVIFICVVVFISPFIFNSAVIFNSVDVFMSALFFNSVVVFIPALFLLTKVASFL